MKRISMTKSLAFVMLGILVCCQSLAYGGEKKGGGKAAELRKVTSVEGITEYQLSTNGLKVLLFPDSAASTVTVNLTMQVGSRHEGYGETGMAHLLEHMLFKGSPKFLAPDKALQEHGAASNGTTWVDRTNYYETMPATDENLKFGIELEADRIVNSFIKREDLAKEMTVVRNEFEIGENDPEGILSQRMMTAAYQWHNYRNSTIGNRTDIERVPIEKLQAFYRKYYQPNNAVLVVAGKFNEKLAKDLIIENFGPIPPSKEPIEQTYTEEPPQDGERIVLLRRVGKVPVVGLIYHTPAAAHPDHAAADVLARVLGHSPSGRLYQALVKTKKASSVSVDVSSWHDPGVLEISAHVAPGVTPEEVRDILIAEVEGLAKKPITEEEAVRAKTQFASSFDRRISNSKTIGLALSEWIGAGDWRLMFIHRDRMAKVSAADANRVAEAYLKTSNRTTGMFFPTAVAMRTKVPETPDVLKLVQDYKGTKEIAAGETFDPTPENIEKRVKRVTLPNGVKVALLPKKTRGETVVANMTLRFGNPESLQPYKTSAGMMGSMMTRGTKKHSRAELTDLFDKLKSTVSFGSSAGALSVSLQSKRPQLDAVLDLVKEVLREPTFPADELDIVKRQQRQALEKGMVDPQAITFRTLMRKLQPYPPDDIRYTPTFKESLERLEKVTRHDLQKLYDEQVAAKVGEISIVGDFDPDAVVKKLENLFAGWDKTVPKYERIHQKAFSVKGGRESIDTPDKENAVFAAAHTFAMRDDDPQYPALDLGNYILGGNFNCRLIDRLRQKEGLCYGAGSQVSVDPQDKYALFLVYGFCNPDNINKVDSGAIEEVQKLIKKGVDPKELELARKGYLEEERVGRSRDGSLAAMLNQLTHLGRTFDYVKKVEDKIGKLTVEEVNRALEANLHPDNLVIIRAGDFSKKAAPEKK
ncbi:MAG: pitrilysin family protein [Gemmataceae bacterium]